MPRPLVLALIASLFIANTINIGADLIAMGAVTKMTIGGSSALYTSLFAGASLVLQMFIPYARYASYLKWLVPAMAAMMWVANRRDQMGQFTLSKPTLVFGWAATAVMAIAAITMVIFV